MAEKRQGTVVQLSLGRGRGGRPNPAMRYLLTDEELRELERTGTYQGQQVTGQKVLGAGEEAVGPASLQMVQMGLRKDQPTMRRYLTQGEIGELSPDDIKGYDPEGRVVLQKKRGLMPLLPLLPLALTGAGLGASALVGGAGAATGGAGAAGTAAAGGGILDKVGGALKGLNPFKGGLDLGTLAEVGLGAAGTIGAMKQQSQANRLINEAITRERERYASTEPLRQLALQTLTAPTPAREDLSALFADPDNPYAQRPQPQGREIPGRWRRVEGGRG